MLLCFPVFICFSFPRRAAFSFPVSTLTTFSLHLIFYPIPLPPFPLAATSVPLIAVSCCHSRVPQVPCRSVFTLFLNEFWVFSASPTQTRVKEGSSRALRGSTHIMDPTVTTHMQKEIGQHWVLVTPNSMQGIEGAYRKSHSHVLVPSPFLSPTSPKENVLLSEGLGWGLGREEQQIYK